MRRRGSKAVAALPQRGAAPVRARGAGWPAARRSAAAARRSARRGPARRGSALNVRQQQLGAAAARRRSSRSALGARQQQLDAPQQQLGAARRGSALNARQQQLGALQQQLGAAAARRRSSRSALGARRRPRWRCRRARARSVKHPRHDAGPRRPHDDELQRAGPQTARVEDGRVGGAAAPDLAGKVLKNGRTSNNWTGVHYLSIIGRGARLARLAQLKAPT